MGKKKQERVEREKQEKKKQWARNAVIATLVIGVVAFLVFTAVYDPSEPTDAVQTIQVERNSDGSLSVPARKLSTQLQKIDFGYAQNLLAMVDENGTVRTAFDTCQECFSTGNAQYSLSGSDALVCSACGNSVSLSELGIDSWGGCKPVSIPPEYRQDTEKEIVFSNELFTYAEEMFLRWTMSDYEMTLENYGE